MKYVYYIAIMLACFLCGCSDDDSIESDYEKGVWYSQVFYISSVDFEDKTVDIRSLEDKRISLEGVSFYDPIVPIKMISDFEKKAAESTYIISSADFRFGSGYSIDQFVPNGWQWTYLSNGLPL